MPTSGSSFGRLGWVCLGLITILLVPSFPLRCFPRAAAVAAGAALTGAALGAALAMITRSRRPAAIYFWLAAAAATVLPLLNAWPPGDSFDLTLWRNAPDILGNYFELLRGAVYLAAMPYPFARFGRHAPDAHSTPGENTELPS